MERLLTFSLGILPDKAPDPVTRPLDLRQPEKNCKSTGRERCLAKLKADPVVNSGPALL